MLNRNSILESSSEDDRKAELESKCEEKEKIGEEKGDKTKEGEELPQEGEKDDGVTGECETGQLQDVEETAAHLDPEENDIQLQGDTKLEEEITANEEEARCQDEVKSQNEEKLQEEVVDITTEEGNDAVIEKNWNLERDFLTNHKSFSSRQRTKNKK